MSLLPSLKARAVGLQARLLNAWFSRGQSPEDRPGRRWELSPEEQAAAYAAQVREGCDADVVNDRTWSDLELGKACARLDRAVGPAGAQYLYALLRVYQTDPEALKKNATLFSELKAHPVGGVRPPD